VIEFELSAGALGRTRFAFSPLAEVAASLRLLSSPHVGHLHQPWLRLVRGAVEGIDLPLLTAVAPPGKFAPNFLYLPSAGPLTTIRDQAHQVEQLTVDEVATELRAVYAGELPSILQGFIRQGAAAPARLADAIVEYWDVAIEPYWQRMCTVLEDDVSHRASRSVEGGLLELLNDIHPEMRVAGNVLMIDKPQHRSAHYSGAELTLTPAIFIWPQLLVGHSRAGRFELIYAARGVARVWEGLTREPAVSTPLAALIGRGRALILTSLRVPMTTTQLTGSLNLSPATISQHLSILRAAGMVESWRSGRKVLYRLTPLAESVLDVATLRASDAS
jgi:DNA-binding transcriptional ArsR family regulator